MVGYVFEPLIERLMQPLSKGNGYKLNQDSPIPPGRNSFDTGAAARAIQCAVAATPEEREAVFALRMLVFVEEQAVPPEEELDAYDLTALHFLVRAPQAGSDLSDQVIGAARLLDKGEGVGKIGRVAIRADYRGQGIGRLLMRFIEQAAAERGFCRMILEAQVHAIPFYEKLGYLAEGPVFLDANIPHRLMSRDLG